MLVCKIRLKKREFEVHSGRLADLRGQWRRQFNQFIMEGGSLPLDADFVFLAVHDGKVIGYAGYHTRTHALNIISVLDEFRHQHLGTVLTYLTVSEMQRAKPGEEVWGAAMSVNSVRLLLNMGAQLFYERKCLGFSLIADDRSEYYELDDGLLLRPNRKEKNHILVQPEATPKSNPDYTFARVNAETARGMVEGRKKRVGSLGRAEKLFGAARS